MLYVCRGNRNEGLLHGRKIPALDFTGGFLRKRSPESRHAHRFVFPLAGKRRRPQAGRNRSNTQSTGSTVHISYQPEGLIDRRSPNGSEFKMTRRFRLRMFGATCNTLECVTKSGTRMDVRTRLRRPAQSPEAACRARPSPGVPAPGRVPVRTPRDHCDNTGAESRRASLPP